MISVHGQPIKNQKKKYFNMFSAENERNIYSNKFSGLRSNKWHFFEYVFYVVVVVVCSLFSYQLITMWQQSTELRIHHKIVHNNLSWQNANEMKPSTNRCLMITIPLWICVRVQVFLKLVYQMNFQHNFN